MSEIARAVMAFFLERRESKPGKYHVDFSLFIQIKSIDFFRASTARHWPKCAALTYRAWARNLKLDPSTL
jgi:hypothetical protein